MPNSFRAHERGYVHNRAKFHGLLSKSRGNGANRAVTVFKDGSLNYLKHDCVIQVTGNSRKNVVLAVGQHPLTRQEKQDLIPTSERDRIKGKKSFSGIEKKSTLSQDLIVSQKSYRCSS